MCLRGSASHGSTEVSAPSDHSVLGFHPRIITFFTDGLEGQVLLEREDVQVGSGPLLTSCFGHLLPQPLFAVVSGEGWRQGRENLDVTVPPFPVR